MKTSYLYLMVDANEAHARFKIGYSVDPFRRQATLEQDFDLEKSWQIKCNREVAKTLEHKVHALFNEHRVDPLDIGWCDGRTEWFDIQCFDKVVEAMREIVPAENFETAGRVEKVFNSLRLTISPALHLRIKLRAIETGVSVNGLLTSLFEATYLGE